MSEDPEKTVARPHSFDGDLSDPEDPAEPEDEGPPKKRSRAATMRLERPRKKRKKTDKMTRLRKHRQNESRLGAAFGGESEGPIGVLLNPLVAWATAGGFLLVVLFLLFTGGGGVDGDTLGSFFTSLDAEQFSEAEEALDDLAVPDELAARWANLLEQRKKSAVRKLRNRAAKLFKAKKHQEAVNVARDAEAISPAPETLYLIAEGLRLLADKEQGEAYDAFLSAYPNDGRADDALFWRAESHATAGRKDKARALFEKIVAMPKSNFKRSAARRLAEL